MGTFFKSMGGSQQSCRSVVPEMWGPWWWRMRLVLILKRNTRLAIGAQIVTIVEEESRNHLRKAKAKKDTRPRRQNLPFDIEVAGDLDNMRRTKRFDLVMRGDILSVIIDRCRPVVRSSSPEPVGRHTNADVVRSCSLGPQGISPIVSAARA